MREQTALFPSPTISLSPPPGRRRWPPVCVALTDVFAALALATLAFGPF